jgi:hypothetical protein
VPPDLLPMLQEIGATKEEAAAMIRAGLEMAVHGAAIYTALLMAPAQKPAQHAG